MDLEREKFPDIIKKFGGDIDRAEFYELIVMQALELTHGDYASLFLSRDNSLVRSFASKKILYLSNKPRENGRTMQAFLTKEPFTANQFEGSNGNEILRQLKVNSILYIPIVFEERCIGVINVIFTKPITVTTEDKKILRTFGEHVGNTYNKLYPLSYLHV